MICFTRSRRSALFKISAHVLLQHDRDLRLTITGRDALVTTTNRSWEGQKVWQFPRRGYICPCRRMRRRAACASGAKRRWKLEPRTGPVSEGQPGIWDWCDSLAMGVGRIFSRGESNTRFFQRVAEGLFPKGKTSQMPTVVKFYFTNSKLGKNIFLSQTCEENIKFRGGLVALRSPWF